MVSPLGVGDYRPISLIGIQYKILAKILAIRLAEVVDKVVSQEQTAFIKKRQILDGPLVVNEVLNWAKRKKRKVMVLKIDFEKAYDSLSWDYLDQIMEIMGFSNKWRGWIRACLHSARASVLVNGSPTEEFRLFRGLRQGDPLSPFLFILAMEGLHISMLDAIGAGLYSPIMVGDHNVSLSHLLYVDDALFIGVWSKQNMENLVGILHCYYLASGLRLNLGKSNLFGVGVSFTEVERLALLIGCGAAKFPFTYLGLPVGANMSRVKSWDSLMEKFNRRLSSWKVNSLSIGGRSVLLKAVLGALGIYYMSLFVLPVAVAKKMEALRARFFWGGTAAKRKMHWVQWDKVLAAKEAGGLEIGSIVSFNLALLLKWRWRFVNGGQLLWVQIITSIYGADGGFYSPRRRVNGESPWDRILRMCSKLDDTGVVTKEVLSRQVGDGRDTRFWLDCWIGEMPLCKKFPRLAALEVDIGCMVADRWSPEGWSWQWRRQFEGGVSHSQLACLVNMLHSFSCSDHKDVWRWNIDEDGEFSVGGTRRLIDSKVLLGSLTKTRWNNWVPSKVNIFIWRLLLGRIPTRTRLRDRGIDVGSVLCPICGGEQETVEHLFIRCKVAEDVWNLVFRWLQIQRVQVHNISGFFAWVDGISIHQQRKKMVDVVVCNTLWFLWRFRNDVVYDAGLIRKSVLFDSIREFSFCWVSNRQKRHLVNWTSWLQNPLNILYL